MLPRIDQHLDGFQRWKKEVEHSEEDCDYFKTIFEMVYPGKRFQHYRMIDWYVVGKPLDGKRLYSPYCYDPTKNQEQT